jgi:hypothetical protein
MKKYLLIIIALFTQAVFLVSCGNDDPDPDPVENGACTGTIVLQKDSIKYETGGSEKREYIYNDDKKVVKILYTYNSAANHTKFDTVIYANTSSTEIASVKSYNTSNLSSPFKTNTYTYSGGKLISVNEVGTNTAAYNRTRSYIYNGGVISKMKINYTSGAREAEEIDSITNIVITNGNVTSAKIHAAGAAGNGQTVSLAYSTDAPNPYLGLNTNIEDPMTMFNANNATSATVGGGILTIFTRTYTYSNGRVATSHEETTGETTLDRTLTYACL